MNNLSLLFHGMESLITVQNMIACVAGSFLGLIVGALPGLGCISGCALLLPLTFSMNPVTGITMLGSLYYSTMFGGAYSSILLNIPGEAAAVMTTMDGYPMAKGGRPGAALFTSISSSFIGGLIGLSFLTLLGPVLARVGLSFGPPEMAALMILALTSIGWLMGENPVKGLISAMLGLILATIGMDAIVGSPRYHFGNTFLLGGLDFAAVGIGLFGFSQVLQLIEQRNDAVDIDKAFTKEMLSFKNSVLKKEDWRRILPPAIRSGIFGPMIGSIPGAGATTATFLCYSMQKLFKSSKPLGTGAIEGLAACESANNAAAAGAFAPMLSLGIPGSATTALLLSALMVWGLQPGPLLFTNNSEFAWSTIAALFLSNMICLIMCAFMSQFMIRILKVPAKYMIPAITFVCFVGSFAISNSTYGIVVMIATGLLGYVMEKYKYPLAPLLLAFVLEPMFEQNVRKTLLMSQGSVSIFFAKPISLVIFILLAVLLLTPLIRSIVIKNRKRQTENRE